MRLTADESRAQLTADDGTPIADILAHNKELTAELAEMKRRMNEIIHLCGAKTVTAVARRNAILKIARKKV